MKNRLLKVFQVKMTANQFRKINHEFNESVATGKRGIMVGIEPNLPRNGFRVFILNEAAGKNLSRVIYKEVKTSPKCVRIEKPL